LSDKLKELEMEKKAKERRGLAQAFATITHIGFTMAICIIGCTFLGIFLDGKFGTGNLFMFIFIALGVGSAFRAAYKIITSAYK
jgi:F0F1-type ATP synthase assembly protein I